MVTGNASGAKLTELTMNDKRLFDCGWKQSKRRGELTGQVVQVAWQWVDLMIG